MIGPGKVARGLAEQCPMLPACAVIAVALHGPIAYAAILRAGSGEKYAKPSAAIAAAHDGDTVLIDPGTYYDCAIVRGNDLTIAGAAPGVVLTDLTCAGKALLVIDGHNVTIRNLALARARVPDGNGAGIRAEGHNLTVEDVQFINDEDGILAAPDPGGTIDVSNSLFERDGICDTRCGYGIEVGTLRLLQVVHTRFEAAGGGSHILSAARTTDLVGNMMTDAGVRAPAPLVFISGGGLGLLNNTFTLRAPRQSRPGAVLIMGDSAQIAVRGNVLREPAGQKLALLRNWTGQPASAADNQLPPGANAVSAHGEVYHRLRARLAVIRDSLHADAGRAKRLIAALLRRMM